MSAVHDPNPLHLPPKVSAEEYERKIAALRAERDEALGVLAGCVKWMNVATWQGHSSHDIAACIGHAESLLPPSPTGGERG